MSGFFENSTPAGSTPTTDATVSTEASFYGSYPNGDPMTIAQPFEGVLQPSTNHIGSVNVDNFPASFSITNFPGTQNVQVGNFPAVQRVSLDFPATQNVNVLNLVQDQQVHGAVSITNWPSNQNVTLTGDSTVKALLLSGTSHIGSVNLDAPITGTVMVSNFPANQPVTVGNFPQTQAVTGTVSVGNFPSQTKVDTSTPLNVWIKGSDVSLGDGSSGGGSLNGNVTIINTGAKPVPVSIVGGQSTFSGSLSAGTAHIGQVSIDQPVQISGTVPVSIASVPTHGVTIQGTPSVAIANPITHLSIDNLPAVQAVSGSVSISNLPPTQVVSGTVNIGNLPATQVVSGIVSLAANSAVQVSGKVQVDTSTPLQVAVPAAVSVKNDGTNYLNTTLNTGEGTVGSDNPLPVQFLSAIQVDTSTPLRVEVTNPSSGGGSGPSTVNGNVTVSGGTLSGIANVVQVAGTVSLSSNSIQVSNFPAIQPVSGSVSATITGTPTVALASNSVTIGNTAANPVQVSLPDNTYLKTTGGVPAAVRVSISDYYGTQFGISASSPLQVQVAKNDPYNAIYVSPSGSFNVQIQNNGSAISKTNTLFTTQVGTANVAMIGVDGLTPVSPTNGLPVAIVSGSAGGGGSVSGTVSTIDGYTSATAGSVTLSGGSTAVTLAQMTGKAIDLINISGTDIEYARGASTVYFPIPNGSSRLIIAITDASQIKMRRRDQSPTAITIAYEVLA